MNKAPGSIEKAKERIFAGFDGIASAWIFVLMMLIAIDVFGRVFFNMPFKGTPELISNSIIIITFLELPYVLMKDRHVRSTMMYDKLGPAGKDVIDLLASLVGMLVFILLIKSSLNDFIKAVKIGEFEGEGALRVPTSPARFIMIAGSVFMVLQYLYTACVKSFSIVQHIKQRRQ
jgi:TRAP-type C4-dicarboxylate transport system permease small subunit